MTWLLCYDIEDDRLRTKLATLLEKEGWERLQKSVFAAGMEAKIFNRFFKKIKDKFESQLKENDKIYVWPLSDAVFTNVISLGRGYDAKWIQNGYDVFYIGEDELLK